ncbi:MAG: LTA synthase family protein [Candidatus Doudnabacteria bacterium]
MNFPELGEKLRKYLKIAWLLLLLVILLVLETYFFNRWLNIIPQLYFVRRTASAVGLGALVFGPAVFFNKRGRRHLYLLLTSALLTLIFLSQFIYYKYSGGFLQFSALFYAGQASDLTATIKNLITAKLLLFIAPIIFVALSFWSGKDNYALSKKEKLAAAALIFFVFAGGYGTLLALEKHDWGDTTRLYSKIYDLGTLVGKIGIVNFYIEDAAKFALQMHQVSAAGQDFVENWVANRPQPAQQPKNFGIAKGRNLIVIQVESLENWPINGTVGGQEITPNLNKIAATGMYFNNYYSQIAEGNTADAEFSTMDSLYPLPDSVVFITHAQNQLAALPYLLKNNGYTTAVMHGDVATFWNRSNIYPSIGYQKVFTQADYKQSRPIGFDGLGDEDFFEQSLPKLQSLKQPFMATAITLSSHTPFNIPEDLQTLDIPAGSTAVSGSTSDDGSLDLDATRTDYLESVHYADSAIGKFIDGLKADGLYDNSVIVIYGDHNAFIDTADSAANQVPMILLAPGLPLNGINSDPASHLDLYPTLANLLGMPAPKTALGQDLFNTADPVATQRNIITGSIKFIVSKDKKYTATSDTEFGNGTCQQLPDGKVLAVSDCEQLFKREKNKIKVSDIVVRYNQLQLLSGH